MAFNLKKVLSGVLATTIFAQGLFCSNVNTVEVIAEALTPVQTKEDLIETFEERVLELKPSNGSDVSLFSLFSNNDDVVSNINISGYIDLEDGRNKEISVIIFDDNWNTISETTVYPNEYFNISADDVRDFTSTTHIKVECNGYLPRFYKDMGFGSYQIGTSENPEMLLFGDTTYNTGADNQWSDEVINYDDLNFVANQLGKIKGDENYDEYYDFNQDGIIDNEDIKIIAEYDGAVYEDGILYTSADKEYYYIDPLDILKYDFNQDNIIDTNDQQFVCDLYPYATYKGDEDFDVFAYMDIDDNGIIEDYDYSYFENYISQRDGCNPYNDYIYNLTLTGNCYHDSAMYLENTNLDLAEYELVINGNFVFRTANPYNSMWNGNPEVILNINNGTLYIEKQFDFGQANSYDKIIMTEENGELYINENWNYITLADMEGLWTDGIIGLLGNTWQVNEASGAKSVYSSGEHKIWFAGYENGQQVIRWDNLYDQICDPNTGERNTERYLNFNYTDRKAGLCLGIVLSKEYNEENYYFRPALPDYVTLYQDNDHNGVNDSIDKIFEDGQISPDEEVPKQWITDALGEESIYNLIDDNNPYEEENTNALAKFIYDVQTGLEGAVNAYETVKNTLVELSESIPDEVKLAYDGARFIISLSPDPICQTIDFVLSIGDVGYDLLTFECTTEWLVDFGLDVVGVIPYVGCIKEFAKNADNFKHVDGLVGLISQKGMVNSLEELGTKALPDAISSTFKKNVDDIIPKVDNLLKDEDTVKTINKLSKSVVDDLAKISPKEIDRQVNIVRIGLENGEEALKTINNIVDNKSLRTILDIFETIPNKNITDNFIDIIKNKDYNKLIDVYSQYGSELPKTICKYKDYYDKFVELLNNDNNLVKKYYDKLNNINVKYADDVINYNYAPGRHISAETLYINDIDKYIKLTDEVAPQKYVKFRADNNDINEICKNTGWNMEDITKIKNHIFNNLVVLDESPNEWNWFNPNYDMTLAWERLINGNFYGTDILLLKHELYELTYYNLLKQFIELPLVSTAHDASNLHFNWQQSLG